MHLFQFYKFELVLKNLDKYETNGAHLSVALSDRRRPDRVPGVQTMAPPLFSM
jgi:hypothetical protein